MSDDWGPPEWADEVGQDAEYPNEYSGALGMLDSWWRQALGAADAPPSPSAQVPLRADGAARPLWPAEPTLNREPRPGLVSAAAPQECSDVYHALRTRAGLRLRLLNTSGVPWVLGAVHPAHHALYLDWQLVPDIPLVPAGGSPEQWCHAVDSSPVARFLVAWGTALWLSGQVGEWPILFGYAPRSPSGMPPDEVLRRYPATFRHVCALLVPLERLRRQMADLGPPQTTGRPAWSARTGGETGPMRRAGDELVEVLARVNRCPALIIRAVLDGTEDRPVPWWRFESWLHQDLPALAQRRFHVHAAVQEAGLLPRHLSPGALPEAAVALCL